MSKFILKQFIIYVKHTNLAHQIFNRLSSKNIK